MVAARLNLWLPVVFWAALIFTFSAIPSLGTGLGTAPLVRSRLAGAGGEAVERGATAAPADFVVGGGLVGVLLGGWFLVALLRRVVGRRKEPGSRLAACLLAGSFAGLLALAVLSLSGLMPVAGSLCAFLLAGLAVASQALIMLNVNILKLSETDMVFTCDKELTPGSNLYFQKPVPFSPPLVS